MLRSDPLTTFVLNSEAGLVMELIYYLDLLLESGEYVDSLLKIDQMAVGNECYDILCQVFILLVID